MCQYSCEEGYQLSMSRPLTCAASEEWSEQPPTCDCELMRIANLQKMNSDVILSNMA